MYFCTYIHTGYILYTLHVYFDPPHRPWQVMMHKEVHTELGLISPPGLQQDPMQDH